jgi:hypothetical protein
MTARLFLSRLNSRILAKQHVKGIPTNLLRINNGVSKLIRRLETSDGRDVEMRLPRRQVSDEAIYGEISSQQLFKPEMCGAAVRKPWVHRTYRERWSPA